MRVAWKFPRPWAWARPSTWKWSATKAEASGDFVLVAEEVNPVAKALLKNGIEVTAVHGHMAQGVAQVVLPAFLGARRAGQIGPGVEGRPGCYKYKNRGQVDHG